MSGHVEILGERQPGVTWTVTDRIHDYGVGDTPQEAAADFERKLIAAGDIARERLRWFRACVTPPAAPLPPQ